MSANDPSTVGKSLRERRMRTRLSQQALADLAGCSISMVRLLERGYQPPQSAARSRIVAVLDQRAIDQAPTTSEEARLVAETA